MELKQSRQEAFEDFFNKALTLLFHCTRVKNLKRNESKEPAEGLCERNRGYAGYSENPYWESDIFGIFICCYKHFPDRTEHIEENALREPLVNFPVASCSLSVVRMENGIRFIEETGQ